MDFYSETWLSLEKHLNKLLVDYTSKCLNEGTSYKDLLRYQGRVAVVRSLLDLPHKPQNNRG